MQRRAWSFYVPRVSIAVCSIIYDYLLCRISPLFSFSTPIKQPPIAIILFHQRWTSIRIIDAKTSTSVCFTVSCVLGLSRCLHNVFQSRRTLEIIDVSVQFYVLAAKQGWLIRKMNKEVSSSLIPLVERLTCAMFSGIFESITRSWHDLIW